MKFLWLTIGLISLSAQAYYGEDNRKEFFEISDLKIQSLAKSTAYQVERHYELRGWTFNRLWTLVTNPYEKQKICPEEKYVKQPALRKNCSGVLISKKHILTAGNCITAHYCKNDLYYWMFDYNIKSAGEFSNKRPRKNFYKCHKVLKRIYNPNTETSYALIELKKEVKHLEPVKMNLGNELEVNDEVFVLGHMRGLPIKMDDGAQVTEKSNKNYLVNSDLPGRFSLGSGVFNSKTQLLEGIMVHGTTGYSKTSEGCYKEDYYNNSEAYEYVFKIQEIKDLLKSIL